MSLGTSDKQVAEKIRSELLREKQHERAGLIAPKIFRDSAIRKLSDHLSEFIGDLKAKGRNDRYIAEFENRILLMMNECLWRFPQDMTPDSFVAWRTLQNKAPKTLNEYLTCAKGFAAWLKNQGRIAANPLALIQKVETRGREVRQRRAYTETEFAALLSVVGDQRIVYLTAKLTGIRHGELKELRWIDFDLDSEKPSVKVRASVSKNHKFACLPLHPFLVEELRQFRPPNFKSADFVFGGLVPRSKLFNQHLKLAKIDKVDSHGRIVDFHSLRHTFCTNLHCAGVSQREAMELMRHNDPRLTAKTYTDASLLSLQGAVEKLKISPSQIASQKLVAGGVLVAEPVSNPRLAAIEQPPVNKGGLSLFDAGCLVVKPR